MRFTGRTAARIGALGIAVAAIAIPTTTSHAAGTPTISATPNDGLQGGQTVSVTGTNQKPSVTTNTAIVECSGLNPDGSDCDFAHPTTFTTDADGNIPATDVTVRTGAIGTGGKTCPSLTKSDQCYLVATTDASDPTDVAAVSFTPITFAPVVALTPSKNIKDGTTVNVSGYGFLDSKKGADLIVTECALPPGQTTCGTNIVFAKLGASGQFSKVPLTLHTGQQGTDTSSTCEVGTPCLVAATTDTSGENPDLSGAAGFAFVKGHATTPPAATKTTAKFHKKSDKITGKVTSGGSGVKGLKTELDKRKAGHWKMVDSAKTHKGGKVAYKHVKNGKYRIATHKSKHYKASHSKPVKAKV
ncbi:MAG: hypothetical protein JO214_02425 [Frankiaceae bacterium]|nr:hypothetical protein [Frankiaceae bacterium]